MKYIDTPKYNGNIEGGLKYCLRSKRSKILYLKDTIKQQHVFMVFSKRRLNSLDAFTLLVIKPHSTCTTQLVSSTVFESSYFIGNSK